ncbi:MULTISPECIES: nucleotide exchange factor GrpE [Bacillaceae]|uniref:nucleotide exchange factor GrpE n=2 Tax=Bacillales TaxID=1385 RepID=UPI0039827A78
MAEDKTTMNEEIQEDNAEENTEAVFEEVQQDETTADAQNTNSLAEDLEAANAKIAELEAKIESETNRYLRLQADFDNSRRRAKLDMEAAQTYRAQSLVLDLLPAIDNFERALKVEATEEQAKSLYTGMEMVYRGLLDALEKEGVETIKSVGTEFDPHLHQAVMQVEVEDTEPNIVVEEFQKGYKLKDRVIRPAMVKVSQ